MARDGMEAAQAGREGFRPARWAWTTLAGTVLLGLLLFAVIVLASDYSDELARRPAPWGRRELNPGVLGAFELGFAIALIPTIVVVAVTRRLRRSGTELDERASAALGTLAVVVLAVGLVCALAHVPDAQRARLTVATALSVVGAALLVASVWVRHVPRA